MIICLLLFFLSVACLLHSYLFYPWLLSLLANGRQEHQLTYRKEDDGLPEVSVLVAAYNEEEVIEEKIKSIYNSGYPRENLTCYIGSDASTDKTNEILQLYAHKYPNFHLREFPERSGKAKIINALAEIAEGELLLLTDANVFLEKECIYHFAKHFLDPEIALVGGNILNVKTKKDGISNAEKTYLQRENLIKYREGLLWGTMIGAFGGLFMIRKDAYSPVPENNILDDFYISMQVLKARKKAIADLNAIAYEDVSNKVSEEFRRKLRISMGNFQNLSNFASLLSPSYKKVAFSFFSHKVLRWLGPFFLLIALGTSLYLSCSSSVFYYLSLLQLALMCIPLLDMVLKSLSIHLKPIRFLSHFYLMNLALLFGFFRFITGVKSNIWQPTERNQ